MHVTNALKISGVVRIYVAGKGKTPNIMDTLYQDTYVLPSEENADDIHAQNLLRSNELQLLLLIKSLLNIDPLLLNLSDSFQSFEYESSTCIAPSKLFKSLVLDIDNLSYSGTSIRNVTHKGKVYIQLQCDRGRCITRQVQENNVQDQIALPTAPAAAVGPIIPRCLPYRLPRLRRRLDVHSGGIHSRPSNHHSTGRGGRLAHGRIVVRDATRGGPHHPTECSLVLDLVSGHNIHQEIEYIGAGYGGGDVVLLERAPLVLLGVEPGSDGELEDEELAGLGEENGRLGGDHAHVLVGLHDLLDAGEGELVVLEIVDMLDLLALVGPEHVKLLLLLLKEMVERRGRGRSRGGLRRVRGGLGLLVVLHW
ncbi:hypothetical protein G2W53_007319 [Senna tora]|uniref:Uncharacterized protein n=1 Tax=Senna tora TaxID=362788 RepID=A0A834X606_9FABA|nr:hypothetical protein G2W53_007319 [Senna tora]